MNDLDVVGTKEISVTFVNGVEDADIWILPQTEENLKTSLWGTPTFSKMMRGETETHRVAGGAEKYIVRIIDSDGAYYAARDFYLRNGYTVRFTTDSDKYDAGIVVLDEKGELTSQTDGVFEGVIG